jgi:sedoheptulokinase
MYFIGIDIGTTSVSGVLVDLKNDRPVSVRTVANDSALKPPAEFADLQDPERIVKIAVEMAESFVKSSPGPVCGIGVTGQMHGVAYVGKDGRAVSPLFTWRDRRGSERTSKGETYAELLSKTTKYPCASGYAHTTHFYNIRKKLFRREGVGRGRT